MSEEKDEATMAAEQASLTGLPQQVLPLTPQLEPSPGLPERQAVRRRHARMMPGSQS
jgi:phospholipid/cholesterol/gamma-HCH transport system ATP-binding protein